jgi:hypothetical protein
MSTNHHQCFQPIKGRDTLNARMSTRIYASPVFQPIKGRHEPKVPKNTRIYATLRPAQVLWHGCVLGVRVPHPPCHQVRLPLPRPRLRQVWVGGWAAAARDRIRSDLKVLLLLVIAESFIFTCYLKVLLLLVTWKFYYYLLKYI